MTTSAAHALRQLHQGRATGGAPIRRRASSCGSGVALLHDLWPACGEGLCTGGSWRGAAIDCARGGLETPGFPLLGMEAAELSTTPERCRSHRGTMQRTTIGRIDMRNLYALVLGASMSLAPAVSFASVTSHGTTTHRDSTTLTMPAVANESTRATSNSDDMSRY